MTKISIQYTIFLSQLNRLVLYIIPVGHEMLKVVKRTTKTLVQPGSPAPFRRSGIWIQVEGGHVTP